MSKKNGLTKILILDKEKSFCHMVSVILGKCGHKVLTASSGEKALRVLGKRKIHLAIVDIGLPGIDGFELTSQIKKNYPRVEIILTSTSPVPQDEMKAFKLGAFKYFPKPFRPDELEEIVEECISLMESKDQA